jgi:hypothetical protein
MKPLTLAAMSTAVLAIGMLLTGPAQSPPQTQAPHQPHAPASPAPSSSPSLSAKHRPTQPPKPDLFPNQARHIASLPPDTHREDAIRTLAQEWARNSPSAAHRWASALEDPAERERALTHLCLEVTSQDPREAIRIARSHRLHPATVDSILTRWARTDFPAASSWLRDLPEGETRDRLLIPLVQSRASDSPAEAAALLSTSPLFDQAQEEAAMTIVHQWILKDPEAARQWVDLFPEGPLKERAAAAVQGMTAYRGSRDGR